MISRRRFIAAGGAAVLAPRVAYGQPPGKGHRIGLLVFGSAPSFAPRIEAFRRGLRELGYLEGQSIILEYRYAGGKLERLPELAAELVALKVDVIVTSSTPAIRAAMQTTRTIPIIMANVADPVQAGLVASLAKPGGNVTGVSNIAPELDGKRLALLREALPKVIRVGFILDPVNSSLAIRLGEVQGAARMLGISVQTVEVRNAGELESGIEAASRDRVGALIATAPVATLYGKRLVEIAARRRLPVIYDTRDFVAEWGGLMAYGPDFLELHRRAATYVDRILKGARPADLPVEQPTKFELVVNLKTAKALGLTLPRSLILRADQVIE